jgi:RNase adapter protein RapZ
MDRLLILSGMSGSGKSTAIRALEDVGYYCVDNLPPPLLLNFIELCSKSLSQIAKAALVIDIREGEFFNHSINIIKELREKGYNLEVLFLDSSDEALVKRYKNTRRKHPLSPDGNILEVIAREREKLSSVSKIADHLIDTSSLNVHQLRAVIQDRFGESTNSKIYVTLMSFGTSYSYPYDADIVIDVRFLPNPYFIEHLKDLNGLDKEVIEFVIGQEETITFIDKLVDLFEFLIPRYKKEGKSYITIAFGCTGGKHRSVVLVNEISKRLKHFSPKVSHRDVLKN